MTDAITEIIKCKESFPYFCKNYAMVLHPERGLVHFNLHPFQENKVYPAFETKRFVIIRKFRQGGLSTISALFCLWKILFFVDQRALIISKTDEDAVNVGAMVSLAWENLPDWMKCEALEKNKHVLKLETGSEIRCGTPKRGRGFSANILVIDEASFIPAMDEVWKGIFPTISAAGSNCRVFVVSTVNGMGNWYANTWHDALAGKNSFYALDLHYTEHPEYNNPEYVEKMKQNLGPRGWDQEVLGIFLSSSDTFIRPERIKEISENIENNPIEPKKLFDEKLWVYSKPKPGRSYLLSADVAEGLGGEHDASAFHVLDMVTLDQVVEFSDNQIGTYAFAKIINEIGKHYNESMVVIENNALGVAVLDRLSADLDYSNIYYSRSSKKSSKMGFTMNSHTRPLVMNLLSNLIENKHVKIKSSRLLGEIQTLEYSASAGRAQARRGKHDDLVMALAIGLFTRNSIISETPIGAIGIDMNDAEFEPTFDMSHTSVLTNRSNEAEYEQPRSEDEENESAFSATDYEVLEIIGQDDDDEALLKEFGW